MSELPAQILEAAIGLFAERGYGSTSMRDVARAVGVSNPTLYYHFKNKEALYLAAVEDASNALVAEVEAALSLPGDLPSQLAAYLRVHIDFARVRPERARLLATANSGALPGAPKVDLLTHPMRSASAVLAVLTQAQARGDLRPDLPVMDAFFALTGAGVVPGFALLSGHLVDEGYPTRAVDLFLRGARIN